MKNHTLTLDLEANRHLIIGDIHGRYELLMKLLDLVNYDPVSDVLYTVGDLIDRGPQSFEVVTFFEEERRYTIKGNHELMLLDSDWLDVWWKNGGRQCHNSMIDNNKDIDWLKNIVRKYPWVIDVGDREDEESFRIIHAEMPPQLSESHFQDILNSVTSPADSSFSPFVWSRNLVLAGIKNVEYMKPSQYGINFHPERYYNVFAGHTPIRNIIRVGDHWFLDTWKSKSLSLIDAITKEKFQVFIPK